MNRLVRRIAAAGTVSLVAAAVTLVGQAPAGAYMTFQQLCGGGKFSSASQGVYIAAATVPTAWTSAIDSSRQQWNGISGSGFSYSAPVRVTGPLPPAGGHGTAVRYYNIQANDGIPANTPAWTSNLDPLSVNHGIAYVNLSNQWSWNTTGTLNQASRVADVRTVVTHEMGHANGLAHPWQGNCSGSANRSMTDAEKASVMNVTWVKKWTTNSDDKAAMAFLY
ncbi:hypothetical protein Cs7R123_60210 [Catellatospora sp. TT07R-123]|uniref:reprolysin-like metallopeptidase n=1 Tax=Catellatospora sp. TT07R-123 TaxID=2733863 RepID=UPI001B0F1801|nr:M43 family zinc metalloprotease [Catellatospora sp. TT07R-123]GHJ48679.1 hypothetical protein Cs7R123_60210 [Catellatospora sp. TT07R-123]